MPVWVAGAAKAATEILIGHPFSTVQRLEVSEKQELLSVPISNGAILSDGDQALAIAHCKSGAGVDITRDLEVWVFVKWNAQEALSEDWLKIVPGIGVGTVGSAGELCISNFALELLHNNLRPLVPNGRSLRLEVVIPRGRELAQRTSNEAFGVVDGLALIGTQAEVQSSSSPEQLQKTIERLRSLCRSSVFKGSITFVIGENGLDLVQKLGLSAQPTIKVGNWLGPLLVAAAEEGVNQLLLFGYHGKLVKLAGGIFHTHHHLADARIEILIALAVKENLPFDLIRLLGQASTMDAALTLLEANDRRMSKTLWLRLATTVEKRSATYLANYGSWPISIGAALFDKQRRLRWAGSKGIEHLSRLGVSLQYSP